MCLDAQTFVFIQFMMQSVEPSVHSMISGVECLSSNVSIFPNIIPNVTMIAKPDKVILKLSGTKPWSQLLKNFLQLGTNS